MLLALSVARVQDPTTRISRSQNNRSQASQNPTGQSSTQEKVNGKQLLNERTLETSKELWNYLAIRRRQGFRAAITNVKAKSNQFQTEHLTPGLIIRTTQPRISRKATKNLTSRTYLRCVALGHSIHRAINVPLTTRGWLDARPFVTHTSYARPKSRRNDSDITSFQIETKTPRTHEHHKDAKHINEERNDLGIGNDVSLVAIMQGLVKSRRN